MAQPSTYAASTDLGSALTEISSLRSEMATLEAALEVLKGSQNSFWSPQQCTKLCCPAHQTQLPAVHADVRADVAIQSHAAHLPLALMLPK